METPTTRVLLKPIGYKTHSIEVDGKYTSLVYSFNHTPYSSYIVLGSCTEEFEIIVRGNCLVVKLKELDKDNLK